MGYFQPKFQQKIALFEFNTITINQIIEIFLVVTDGIAFLTA